MDIEVRKQRLDAAAHSSQRPGVAWHGETGDECQRCGVQVPAGYLLALPDTDVSGCLRCLEQQAHLFLAGLGNIPDDLVGTGGQFDALRQIAEEFRLHIKTATRGREPLPRREAQSRWAAQSGWESSSAWEAPPAREKPARRPIRNARANKAKPKPEKIRPRHRPAPEPPSARETLGLSGSVTRDEIISAFRRSALICHPDYGGSSDAFLKIVAARDALLAEV